MVEYAVSFERRPDDYEALYQLAFQRQPSLRTTQVKLGVATTSVGVLAGVALWQSAVAAILAGVLGAALGIFLGLTLPERASKRTVQRLLSDPVVGATRLGPFSVVLGPEGIRSAAADGEHAYAWSVVDEVEVRPDDVMFLMGAYQAVRVPNRAFAGEPDRDAFVRYARDRIHDARGTGGGGA